MFSSKTRQLVQKVRSKTSNHAIDSLSSTSSINNNLILNVNDLTHGTEATSSSSSEMTEAANSNRTLSYCHQYSADDVNYLSIRQPFAKATDVPSISSTSASSSAINSKNCLSSSSTSSSTSTSSASCLQETSLVTVPTKILTNKIDPKNLRLGGRPLSICSSIKNPAFPTLSPSVPSNGNNATESLNLTSSSSFLSNQNHHQPLKGIVTIKPPSDFSKRCHITSSPKPIVAPSLSNSNQSPISITSCSSKSTTSTKGIAF